MQNFYTCCSVLLSRFRTALSRARRLSSVVSAHALRACVLLCAVAISAGARGELTSYHTPGIYTTTWKQSLTTFNNREYEVYGFSSTGSSKNYIWAGTTAISGDNVVLSFATTDIAENLWISN